MAEGWYLRRGLYPDERLMKARMPPFRLGGPVAEVLLTRENPMLRVLRVVMEKPKSATSGVRRSMSANTI